MLRQVFQPQNSHLLADFSDGRIPHVEKGFEKFKHFEQPVSLGLNGWILVHDVLILSPRRGFDQFLDLGVLAARGQFGETFGGRAAGLAGAEQVGVAARDGFTADELAAFVRESFAGGERETVIFGAALVEDGKDAVVFGLIDIASDKLAEAHAVANQVHAVADVSFKNRKTALGGKLDLTKLDS
ncbi:MAG: hypothetical protein ABSH34_00330 [Verrucomicrobiota bacterium]